MTDPYLKELKTVVFDIETTGLMSSKDMVINAGFYDLETDEVTQLFAENPQDEKRLIDDVLFMLSRYEAVITYNGDRFDIPFIKTRAKKYSLEDKIPVFWSVDMYRYLKKYWPMAKKMQHLDQKSVEYALGLSEKRNDLIGGGECITLYQSYLLQCDPHDKELILLHNADDIRQLARIYRSASFLPYDKIAFENGFAVCARSLLRIRSIRFEKTCIIAEASTESSGIPASIYNSEYEFEFDPDSGDMSLKLMLLRHENMYFVDLSKLPCDINELKYLSGYHSDFLVVSDAEGIRYREINTLISSIFSHGRLF